MAERRWGDPEGGDGLSVPAHDLSGNRQPLPLSRGLGGHRGRKEEALRETGWPKLPPEVEVEPRSPKALV